MRNIKNKRLLLLGGSLWKNEIKNYAIQNEITLIAAGNNTQSGIFEIADESYKIDSTNIKAMRELLIKKNIDGVYLGGSDAVIAAASIYVNDIGLPCYCTNKQWNILNDKSQLKALFSRFELPVVKNYNVESVKITEDIKYPVITKPADGNGSQGFSVCYTEAELIEGYEKARKCSSSNKVLVEEFVDNTSFVVFYTISDGEIYFSGIEEKYTLKYEEETSYVVSALLFESKKETEFRNLFENKLKQMFENIGLREGNIWIEVFYNQSNYYFNEVGYRYGGSVSFYPIYYQYGYNQLEADINFALTGESNIQESNYKLLSNDKLKNHHYFIYAIHISDGQIKAIEGLEKLNDDPRIIVTPISKKVGDVVQKTGTISQVLGFIHFVFQSKHELNEIINQIHSKLRVIDSEGNNMMRKKLNKKEIYSRFNL